VKLILAALLMFPLLVGAVARDLDDCTIGSTPTALAPLDLDACTINDGDDITGILTGLASTYGNVYVRAPSRDAWVYAAYTVFTVDDFYFLEDESAANTFLIQHVSVNPATCSGSGCLGFFTMWSFSNFDNVVIGGPKLSITLQGNHPGLANCSTHYRPATETGYAGASAEICDINYGFIGLYMSNGTQALLADIRANVKFTQGYALMTNSRTEGATSNSVAQVNLAGLYFATSGVVYSNAVSIWMDPDRTVFSDPFVRAAGWTGEVPGATAPNGLPMGCNDGGANDQVRLSTTGSFVGDITGGLTTEYGYLNFIPRGPGTIGTADAPFIIRIKDWGVSGPGTAYQAGVTPKKTFEAIFFKGDPADVPATDDPVRFVRFIKLPDDYGSGMSGQSVSGCAVNNAIADGRSNFSRFEMGGSAQNRITRGYWFEFSGDWASTEQGGTFIRGPAGAPKLIYFGLSADEFPNYGHTVRAASGTYIQDAINLLDRSTITGPGSWASLTAQHVYTYTVVDTLPTCDSGTVGAKRFRTTDNLMFRCRLSGTYQWQEIPSARNSIVTDTTLTGSVAIGEYVRGTTISNVDFTGSARAVITVGDNSDVTVTDVCVPDGSTITGTGTLIYEGSAESLPFTIPNSTSNCAITADPLPGVVTGGGVE
jgi:hypothetical protein